MLFEKVLFEKVECLPNTYKSGNLKDKLQKMTMYIREFISYLNQLLHILKSIFLFLNFFFSSILANNNLPLKIYCKSIVIIYIDFNLNVLL